MAMYTGEPFWERISAPSYQVSQICVKGEVSTDKMDKIGSIASSWRCKIKHFVGVHIKRQQTDNVKSKTGKCNIHYDVIKWKHLPRYWTFVRGIHRLPVDSHHKG